MGMREENPEKQSWTPGAIAKLCQVAPETVSRWIEGGRLKAFQTAGGHNRVKPEDLADFLRKLNIPLPAELVGHSDLTILVVDDEVLVRKFILRVLKQTVPEAKVAEAGDGFEAGRKLAEVRPRLVVLDLDLPGVDGFQICKTIKSDPDFDGTQVLAITGLIAEEARPRIMAAGADEFLAKPLEIGAFTQTLQRLLNFSEKRGRQAANGRSEGREAHE